MTITLREADDNQQKEWDDTVLSSPHGTIFHTWAWLKIIQKNTNSRFLPLMAYKGNQLVALYPVFIQKKGIFTLAFSPPSRTYLLYLGPVIAGYDDMKQDKKESLLLEIQEGINHFLISEVGCTYIRIRPSPGIYDSRYLSWTGYSVTPQYTYRLNLSGGIDTIWSRFDRKLRVNIHKAEREQVTVKEGNREDLLAISDTLTRRFQEQGFKTNDYRNYLMDIYDVFYPEHLKIFVAYYHGECVGGMVSLCFNKIMYLWIGIPKSDIPGLSPNDLVQWEAIKWACRNGFSFYEVMDGGDNLRLRGYKAKYNPHLCIWYTGEKYSSAISKIIGTVLKLL
jgi:predicted N-acyltransferase